jgi:hypothetical protein
MSGKTKQSKKDLKWVRRRSYLLRLWRTDDPGGSNWQASLETPGNGERIGFASLEELFAYLLDLTTTYEQDDFRRQDSGESKVSESLKGESK